MNALRLPRAVMVVSVVLTLAGVVAGGLGAGSCGGTIYVWVCSDPDGGGTGTVTSTNFVLPCANCCCTEGPKQAGAFPQGDCLFGEPADGGADAGEGGPLLCDGQCLPNAPNQWGGPELVWIGDALTGPGCPSQAAGLGYEGHAGLTTAPRPCGACSCTPPMGTCGLPATITASAAPCYADGGVPTAFDPPPAWDGGCTTYDAVAAGVGSVTTASLALTENGCLPVQAPVTQNLPGLWSTDALGCTSSVEGSCASTGEMCVPSPPAGFHSCIWYMTEGVMDCPSFGPYTEPHVFYDSADDTRICSSCTCGLSPGLCSATLAIYSDDACGGAAPGAIPVTSGGPECVDVFFPLGSKAIQSVTYTPGTCQPSGGVASGSVTPVGPSTFCCIPL